MLGFKAFTNFKGAFGVCIYMYSGGGEENMFEYFI